MNNDYVLVQKLSDNMDRLNNDIGSIQKSNVITNGAIDNINNSINNIDEDIKKINRINHKRVCIRNIKVFKNILKLIMHPLLAACVALSLSQIFLNDVPFIRQDQVNTMRYEATIDNQGNMSLDNWYSNTNWLSTPAKKKNTWIYKYDKWEKTDKEYYRNLDSYVIKENSLEKIKELFDDPSKLEELYANSKVLLYETKDEITEEELNQENYMKAVLHYEDTDDYYIAPQDEEDNFRDSVSFLILLFGAELFASANIRDMIERRIHCGQDIIFEDYKKIDIDDIKRQFSKKRIEFEKTSKQLKKELSN